MVIQKKSWEGFLLLILLVIIVINSLQAPAYLSIGNQINLFTLSIEKITKKFPPALAAPLKLPFGHKSLRDLMEYFPLDLSLLDQLPTQEAF